MSKFKKKSYFNHSGFLKDSWFLMRNARSIIRAMQGQHISPKFRERIMLTVTEVNGCRYCSWAHTKMALKSGLKEEEIKGLLQGNLQMAAPEEYPALVFATHWADTIRHPNKEMLNHLKKHYSSLEIQSLQFILQTIWWGNLCGNTLDHLLYFFGAATNK